jgi:hypothetical protein
VKNGIKPELKEVKTQTKPKRPLNTLYSKKAKADILAFK